MCVCVCAHEKERRGRGCRGFTCFAYIFLQIYIYIYLFIYIFLIPLLTHCFTHSGVHIQSDCLFEVLGSYLCKTLKTGVAVMNPQLDQYNT